MSNVAILYKGHNFLKEAEKFLNQNFTQVIAATLTFFSCCVYFQSNVNSQLFPCFVEGGWEGEGH